MEASRPNSSAGGRHRANSLPGAGFRSKPAGRDRRDETTPGRSEPVGEGLELFQRVRPADDLGWVSVTLALINTRAPAPSGMTPTRSSRRPCGLRLPTGGRYSSTAGVTWPSRKKTSSPTGSCTAMSSRWPLATEPQWTGTATRAVPGRATAVFTCMIPRFELRLADSNPAIDTAALGMRHLMRAPRAQVAGRPGRSLRPVRTVDHRDRPTSSGSIPPSRTQPRGTWSVPRGARRMRAGIGLLAAGQRRVGGIPARQQGHADAACPI